VSNADKLAVARSEKSFASPSNLDIVITLVQRERAMIGIGTEDLYTMVIEAIESGDLDRAVEIIVRLDRLSLQLNILYRLERAMDNDLRRAYSEAVQLNKYSDTALALANDGTLNLRELRTRLRSFGNELARSQALANDVTAALFHMNQINVTILRVFDTLVTPASPLIPDWLQFIYLSQLSKITLVGIDLVTPQMLTTTVAPYLEAIANLQQNIHQLKGEVPTQSRIIRLSQNSPIEAELGGVAEAVTTIRDLVVPWRRENAKKLSDLEIEQRQAEINSLQIANKIAESQVDQQTLETEKIKLEIEQMRLANEERRLAIEQKRLELHEAKIQMALTIINRFMPNMPESKRIAFVNQFIKALTVLVESPLTIEDSPQY
jgi:hypothetical protein